MDNVYKETSFSKWLPISNMRIHERIDKIRYFQLGGAGGIEQNPLSHTCASAPLDSPEHVDPQSADHV